MQWPSAVRSIIGKYRSQLQASIARSIFCKHRFKEEKLPSVIRLRRELEYRHRGEDHHSVIMLDYTFLTNPHHPSQPTSKGCHQDVEERVISIWADEAQHIKQQKSSWSDEAHQSIASWSAITSIISDVFERAAAHPIAMHIIVFNTLFICIKYGQFIQGIF